MCWLCSKFARCRMRKRTSSHPYFLAVFVPLLSCEQIIFLLTCCTCAVRSSHFWFQSSPSNTWIYLLHYITSIWWPFSDNHARTSLLSFYRLDVAPAAQPTASKHWRHFTWTTLVSLISQITGASNFHHYLPPSANHLNTLSSMTELSTAVVITLINWNGFNFLSFYCECIQLPMTPAFLAAHLVESYEELYCLIWCLPLPVVFVVYVK